jgi:hypothetical protein
MLLATHITVRWRQQRHILYRLNLQVEDWKEEAKFAVSSGSCASSWIQRSHTPQWYRGTFRTRGIGPAYLAVPYQRKLVVATNARVPQPT